MNVEKASFPWRVKWCGEQHPHSQHLYASPESRIGWLRHCPGSSCLHHGQDSLNPEPPHPVRRAVASMPPEDFEG